MLTYKECKRRWMLEYYMGLRKKHQAPRIAADTGTATHEALHRFYIMGGMDNYDKASEAGMSVVTQARDQALARDLSEEEKDAIEVIYSTTEIITKGYFEWVKETGADDNWKVLGSEEKVTIPGPVEGTFIKGYMDLWGEHHPSNDMLVVDTKVVGQFGQILKTLHINEQGPLYALMMQVMNPEREHRGFRVVWNMIKRNKQTRRAKPPFYQRYELAINIDQLRQFYAQLQGQLNDMLRTEERLNNGEAHVQVAYPTPSQDCSWKCPFVSVCGAMNDPRSDAEWLIQNNYVKVGRNPETSGTVVTDE